MSDTHFQGYSWLSSFARRRSRQLGASKTAGQAKKNSTKFSVMEDALSAPLAPTPFALEGLENRVMLTTFTWDGSSSTDWHTAANWDKNAVPGQDDIAVLPSGAKNTNIVFGTDVSIEQIQITGTGYSLTADKSNDYLFLDPDQDNKSGGSGPGIYLTASSGTTVVDAGIFMGNASGKSFTFSAASGSTLSFPGVIDDGTGVTQNILVNGGGTVRFAATNEYDGTTTVSGNTTLVVAADQALGDNRDGATAGRTIVSSGSSLFFDGGITYDNNGASTKETIEISGSGVGGLGALGNLSGNNSFNGPITMLADATIGTTAGVLTLSNDIGGAFALSITGTTGRVVVTTDAPSFNKATNITSGTLEADISFAASSGVNISGGTLSGNSTVPAITGTGGTIDPGAGGTGKTAQLATGNISTNSSTTFTFDLNGTTVGTGYDRLNTTGSVSLGNATLNIVKGAGYNPTGGGKDSFTLISNDGADAVTGTFNGLSEGSKITIGGQSFTISYVGGDGNDVVLSQSVTNTAPSFTLTQPPAMNEDGGAKTATVATAFNANDAGQSLVSYSLGSVSTTGNLSFSSAPTVSASATDGVISYTPSANTNGTATFTITATDSGSSTNTFTQTVTIVVNAVDDAPTFSLTQPTNGTEDSGAATASIASFSPGGGSDEAGQTAVSYSVSSVSNPGLFSAGPTVGTNGILSYTPTANASGTTTFLLSVTDSGSTGNGGSVTSTTQTVTLTVNAANDAPTISPQSFSVAENAANSTTVGTVVASDIDAGDTKTFSITGGTGASVFAISSAGVITVSNSAALNFETTTSYTLTVRVTDSGALFNEATMTVNVTNVNENPSISPQSFSVAENATNGAVLGTVVSTDVDAGDTKTFSLVGGSGTGVFNVSAAGQITLANASALDADTIPTYSLTVRVTDSGGQFSSATMTVNVTNINENPVIAPQAFSVPENSAATTIVGAVLANDPDTGDSITYSITAGNSLGAFSISSAGVITVASSTPLNREVNPSFVLTVRVTDGFGLFSEAPITINLSNVNEPPTLTTVNTINGAAFNTPFTIVYTALANAADEADIDSDIIFFRIEAVTSGTLTKGGIPVTPGATTIGPNETLVWTPANNATGVVGAFTVKAFDGQLASATTVPVAINISEAGNNAPTMTSIAPLTGAIEDTDFTINYADLAAAADENDLDNDTLSFIVITTPNGSITKNGVPVVLNVTTIGPGESLVWTPTHNANGTLVAFTTAVTDGIANSTPALNVSVQVAPVNDAPTLTTVDTLSGATEDTAFSISYDDLANAANENDVDGDTLSFRVDAVSTGTLTKNGVAVEAGITLLGPGDTLVWTPALNATGSTSAFTVSAWDGFLASDSPVQVLVDITAVTNDPPTLTAVSTIQGAIEDTAFTLTYEELAGSADDVDPDSVSLTYVIQSVTSGTLTKNGVPVTPGTTLNAGESLEWTPAADANGVIAAFTIRASDGEFDSGSDVPVSIDVDPVNDAPTLTTIAVLQGGHAETPITVTYAALAAAADEADVDGDTVSFLIQSVGTGTLTKGGVPVTPGVTTLGPGESLVWTSPVNSDGNINGFAVVATDGSLESSSDINVVFSVSNDPLPPTLTHVDTLTGATEDTAFTITYDDLANAADEADLDSASISFRVQAVSSGTLTKNGIPVVAGTTLLSTGESLVWTPASNANGVVNAFTIVAFDGALASASAVQVAVNVTAVNDAPTLTTITALAGATEDTAFTVTYAALLAAANEGDVDGTTPSFRIESVTNGTLTKNGVAVVAGTTTIGTGESLVWTPATNANGVVAAFSIKAFDGTLASTTSIPVSINVAPVNDAPTLSTVDTLPNAIQNKAFKISYATLAGAANEADVDSTPILFRVSSIAGGTLTKNGVAVVPGTTTIGPGETLVWTPPTDASGTLSAFSVVAFDGALASATPVTVSANVAIRYATDLIPGQNTKFTFIDSQGNKITVSLTGKTGRVKVLRGVPNGQNGDLLEMEVNGTDAKSKVTIAVPAKKTTNVTDITVAGALSALAAGGATVLGDISATGVVSTLTLGNLTSDPTITLGGDLTTKPATVKLGRATGLVFNSTGKINALTVVDWNGGSLTAPALTSLKAAGLKGVSSGDFSANVNLTQNDPTKSNLKTFTVLGTLLDSVITSAGKIDTITVGKMNGSSILIGTTGGVTALATSAADFANKPATPNLGALTIKGVVGQPSFIDSIINAWNIGKVDLKTVTTANSGTPLGLAGDKIASLKFIAAGVNNGKSVTLSKLDTSADLADSKKNPAQVAFPVGDLSLTIL